MRLCDLDILKESVQNICKTYTEMSANQLGYDILRIIDNAPTVSHPNCDNCEDKALSYSMGFQDGYLTDKERPQGEWQETNVLWETNCGGGMGYDYGYYFKCSACDEMVVDKTNFCPNCGAKMKGGAENG